MRQLNALLDHPQRVRQLSALELDRLVDDLGTSDAMPLLESATSEQVRDLLDLNVWKSDRLDTEELLAWVYAVTTLSPEVAGAHLRELDVETLGFLLRARTNIYLADDELPEEFAGTPYTTPDGSFVVELLDASESSVEQLIAVIEALYVQDHEATRRLLANLMWELPSDLEQWSLRWRNARMADLGFDDAVEALRIYAYLDPQSVAAQESTADRPLQSDPDPRPAPDLALMLPTQGESFWAQAINKLADPLERNRLSSALLALSNLNLAADRVDPTDTEHAQRSLEHLRGRLSLGLEHLCEGAVDKAPAILGRVALMRIARLGHSLVLDHQRAVLPAIREGRFGRRCREIDLLPHPLRDVIHGLTRQRPVLYQPDGVVRPLSSPQDLATAAAAVRQAQQTAALVPPEHWPKEIPVGLRLPALFCSDAVNRVLSREGPLDHSAVAQLIHKVKDDAFAAHTSEAARLIAEQRVGRPLDASEQQMVDGWLHELCESLARLDPETFDLRFVACLLVREEA